MRVYALDAAQQLVPTGSAADAGTITVWTAIPRITRMLADPSFPDCFVGLTTMPRM